MNLPQAVAWDADTIHPAAEHRHDTLEAPYRLTPQTDELDSNLVRGVVAARLFGSPKKKIRFGRFEVLEKLGQGGMGVVYLARDDELDRRVAIKIVRGSPTGGTERIRREAQALARLSHPNVVQVHEVGDREGELYIVMEYVEGTPLSEWKADASLDEFLDVFLQAGRGLAAAHARRMVHRDFKPENVLVGNDGRVRVLDFGLALQFEAVPRSRDANPGDFSLSDRITRTGSLAGTPAYMAPEQFSDEPTDARTDVFAFCVALWERIYGERPFRGKTLHELLTRLGMGAPEVAEDAPRIPGRLRRALLRGLAFDPEDRFETMNDLLAELEKVRRRRRRRVLLGMAAATFVSAVVLGHTLSAAQAGAASPPEDHCAAVADELTGAWDDDIRTAASFAFSESGASHATTTWKATEGLLDAYAQDWTALRVQACRDSTSGEPERASLAARQIACLSERRAALDSLTERLTEVPPTALVLKHAATAAGNLEPVSECLRPRPSATELDPRKVTEAAEKIAAARVRFQLGSYADADAAALEARQVVESLGDASLEARLLHLEGLIASHRKDYAKASSLFARACQAAARAQDPSSEAHALVSHISVAAKAGQVELSVTLASEADAALALLGDPPELRVEYWNQRGSAENTLRNFELASEHYEAAFELAEARLQPTHPALIISLNGLAQTYARSGRLAQAQARAQQAHDTAERALGGTHPYVLSILNNQGAAQMDAGRHEDARSAAAAGARALPFFEKSLALRAAREGKGSRGARLTWHNIGEARRLMGEYSQAVDAYDRALELKQLHTPDQVESIARTLTGLGFAHLGLENTGAARASFSRARTHLGADGGDPSERAEAAFGLAQVTEDPEQARALAEEALARFVASPPEWEWEAAQVRRWLATHPAM